MKNIDGFYIFLSIVVICEMIRQIIEIVYK